MPDRSALTWKARQRRSGHVGKIIREDDDTSEKGRKAVGLIAAMLRRGLLPIPGKVQRLVTDIDKPLQIEGQDIIVEFGAATVRIQVKCDYKGGDKSRGGTGFLYLQTAERNPMKKT